jgi:hypothetical protein
MYDIKPDPTPTRSERRRKAQETAKQWGVLIAALTALAGAGTNYLNQAAQDEKTQMASAMTLAKLEAAYGTTRAALERSEAANKERDEKMMALREAIAELRGALDAIGSHRARAASGRAAAAIEVMDQLGAPAPVIHLPASLPEPAPEAIKEKMEQSKR